jgi:thiol-disulfide isomerase/thioredoxin
MSSSLKSGYPKILFFSSAHCTPCQPVEEMLRRINFSMFGKKLYIEKIDVSKNYYLTQHYKITSLPTIIIADKKLSINIQEEDIIDAILYGFISSVEIE